MGYLFFPQQTVRVPNALHLPDLICLILPGFKHFPQKNHQISFNNDALTVQYFFVKLFSLLIVADCD